MAIKNSRRGIISALANAFKDGPTEQNHPEIIVADRGEPSDLHEEASGEAEPTAATLTKAEPTDANVKVDSDDVGGSIPSLAALNATVESWIASDNANDKRQTKIATVIEMLERPEGASIAEIMVATGWQSHSVRGVLAGSLRKKGFIVVSGRVQPVGANAGKYERRYSIFGREEATAAGSVTNTVVEAGASSNDEVSA